jgi:hypothetical protein
MNTITILDLFTPYSHNYKQLQRHCYSSQITTAPAKPFPACCVFTSRYLVMASKQWRFFSFRTQVLSSQPLIQNCLGCPVFLINPLWGPSRKHCFQQYLHCCLEKNVSEPFVSCFSSSTVLALSKYATIFNVPLFIYI